MPLPTMFDLCTPRPDVLEGAIRESEFAADLAQVLNGTAPDEYKKPATFFANTHPTQGLKRLLENVCRRLSGAGGEAASVFRLGTQYGGGKTHALIALAHAAGGMKGVTNVSEFVDPSLVPQRRVRLAAFDGENSDPVNGRALGEGVRAFTPWGELAYQLAGRAGYETVRRSDEQRVAPGAETIRELFGDEPALILLDELSVYLRKVRGRGDDQQLAPFLTGLVKAVEAAPGAVLVFTVAIGKGLRASDAYSEENERISERLDELEKISARKATLLDPTAEDETAQVLRRRLFARIDDGRVRDVVEAYRALWNANATKLPESRTGADRAANLLRDYPFHPALMSVLTDKLSTLGTFQRVRGMLRLLSQGVARVWKEQPKHAHALHVHHLDPGYAPTRNEILTRLDLDAYEPAIRNDVAASAPGSTALAEDLDRKHYVALPPYATWIARTILWNSFAFNEHLKGATPEELRFATLSPGMDAGFVDDARNKFAALSAYLDDRPAAPLRFLTEANLTQVIRRQEGNVDKTVARDELKSRIREVFNKGPFSLVPFPGGSYDVDDAVGDGRPYIVLIAHEAASVRADALRVPDLVERIFKQKGSQGEFRGLQNNLAFLVADDGAVDEMKAKMSRRLALEAMQNPERLKELAPHQQDKVKELYRRSEQELALAIQQCFRHLFYPSRNQRLDAGLDVGHVAFDVQSASEKPGDGQNQIIRALHDLQKVKRADDQPLAPGFARDHTPLKKGQITTADFRSEFRKDVRLPILLGDENFIALVRKGVEDGAYVYKSGDLLYGQGDPFAEIRIDPQCFVLTIAYAKEQQIWPRKPVAPPNLNEVTIAGEGTEPGPGPGPGAPPPPPPGTIQLGPYEEPLKAALVHVFEDARAKSVARIVLLQLRVFDRSDALRLLAAANAVSGAKKEVAMESAYETAAGSTFEAEYRGTPDDAMPLKEFLDAQFKVAKEPSLNTTYRFTFENGLALDSKDPENLVERLARFASGAALVEAYAEAKK